MSPEKRYYWIAYLTRLLELTIKTSVPIQQVAKEEEAGSSKMAIQDKEDFTIAPVPTSTSDLNWFLKKQLVYIDYLIKARQF